MPDAAPPVQSARRPRRRRRWLIPFIALAALVVLIGGWHAWLNRPAGRAEVLLGELREQDLENLGLIDRLRKELGFEPPPPKPVSDVADELTGLGAPVVPTLAAALKDSAPAVRHAAAKALDDIGDASAVPALLPLLKDPDADVRIVASHALGGLGDKRAVPGLLEAMKDPDVRVRMTSTLALGLIGDPAALPGVLNAAKGSPSVLDEGAALEALGQIGGPEALPTLTRALESPEWVVREGAAQGLGYLGGPEVVPLLLKALSDVDCNIRETAASELGYAGDPRATEALVAATRDTAFSVRIAAVRSLAAIGASQAGDAAVPMLGDKEEESVRAVAALVCGIQGRTEALPVLKEELHSEYEALALYAVAGLARLDTPEARRALQEAGKTAKFAAVREMADGALSVGLAAALAKELRTVRPGSRADYRAARILLFLNDPRALPALEEARKTGRAAVRIEAARVIQHLRHLSPAAP